MAILLEHEGESGDETKGDGTKHSFVLNARNKMIQRGKSSTCGLWGLAGQRARL